MENFSQYWLKKSINDYGQHIEFNNTYPKLVALQIQLCFSAALLTSNTYHCRPPLTTRNSCDGRIVLFLGHPVWYQLATLWPLSPRYVAMAEKLNFKFLPF